MCWHCKNAPSRLLSLFGPCCLQAVVRGSQERARFADLLQRTSAAEDIQRAARGFLARKHAFALRLQRNVGSHCCCGMRLKDVMLFCNRGVERPTLATEHKRIIVHCRLLFVGGAGSRIRGENSSSLSWICVPPAREASDKGCVRDHGPGTLTHDCCAKAAAHVRGLSQRLRL